LQAERKNNVIKKNEIIFLPMVKEINFVQK